RNCQNYDLLKEAGASGRPVMLKRGFGTTVEEWLSGAEYLLDAGCEDVLLCERGIRTFEKATRGTLDLGGLRAAPCLTHLPRPGAARRLALCRMVAAVKRATGRPIRDEARENTVRARFAEALGADAPNAALLADALIALGLEAEGWKED